MFRGPLFSGHLCSSASTLKLIDYVTLVHLVSYSVLHGPQNCLIGLVHFQG